MLLYNYIIIIIMLLGWSYFFASQKLVILPGNAPYIQLTEPILPLYKDLYFFNITNPEAFADGADPHIQELGPYSFRYVRDREKGGAGIIKELGEGMREEELYEYI